MAKKFEAHLVGVFLDDFTRHSYSVAEITQYKGSFDAHLQTMNAKDDQARDASVQRFNKACSEAGISFSIHRDKNIALQELLHESIYSDLLIISRMETFTRFEEQAPTRFMKDLLADVLCPVLVVPTEYQEPQKAVMLYDGEPSSVHAVKLFSYLSGANKMASIEVLSVQPEEDAQHIPDQRLMKEFMNRHFPDAGYTVLNGQPVQAIIHHLAAHDPGAIVVLGAYRRGRLSRMFRPSMADVLMKQVQTPLFIAHD
ncbi:MAG: universal stress protein [Flavisolibacter sp.]|nr:universal stress protein [Flavisolibacter sp.]